MDNEWFIKEAIEKALNDKPDYKVGSINVTIVVKNGTVEVYE